MNVNNGTIEILVLRERDGRHVVGVRIENKKHALTWRCSVEEMRAVVSDISEAVDKADSLNNGGASA